MLFDFHAQLALSLLCDDFRRMTSIHFVLRFYRILSLFPLLPLTYRSSKPVSSLPTTITVGSHCKQRHTSPTINTLLFSLIYRTSKYLNRVLIRWIKERNERTYPSTSLSLLILARNHQSFPFVMNTLTDYKKREKTKKMKKKKKKKKQNECVISKKEKVNETLCHDGTHTHTHAQWQSFVFLYKIKSKKRKFTNKIYRTYDRRWMNNDC